MALGISLTCLPEVFHLPTPSKDPAQEEFKVVKNLYMFVCVACGLWGGLLIGLQTEYFTSNAFKPVQVGGDRRVCATVPFATGATVSYHTHTKLRGARVCRWCVFVCLRTCSWWEWGQGLQGCVSRFVAVEWFTQQLVAA